jgi:uncharacterized protein (DUF2147 family)
MIKQCIIAILLFVSHWVVAQSPIGIWKNIDDTDGKEKSHIEIYEQNGMLRGRVIKLLPAATLKTCKACKGANKDKPLEGMDILWDLKKNGATWGDGQILDPKKGKVYDCFIELDGKDKLNVRGYIGVSMFGRTQTWYKV